MLDYRRRLPHWQLDNVPVFITWRLWGSLPSARAGPRGCSPGRAFVLADRELDVQATGPRWLSDSRIAEGVSQTTLAGERERHFYELHAWVVMPNHVHVLLTPFRPLPVITRWLKGATARWANQMLGRTGQSFWQDESFDHWVRNCDEMNRIVGYIEQNPISAGLVRAAEEWPWSSAGWQAKPPAPPANSPYECWPNQPASSITR